MSRRVLICIKRKVLNCCKPKLEDLSNYSSSTLSFITNHHGCSLKTIYLCKWVQT